jgi:hypothetical protein
VRSLDVAEWATGYTRWLAHLGYNPQSAHPWSLGDLQTVLEHLDSRIASATGVPLLHLHRDAFTMTILWETCSRGATAVSWCLDDLWLASGLSPVPLYLAGCTPLRPLIRPSQASLASHLGSMPLVHDCTIFTLYLLAGALTMPPWPVRPTQSHFLLSLVPQQLVLASVQFPLVPRRSCLPAK